MEVPDAPREVWSTDFMSDCLIKGRSFRIFNLMDNFNREILCTRGNFSIPVIWVVEYLREVIKIHGKPLAIRVDNEPKFISRVFNNYCEVKDIEEVVMETERLRAGYYRFHPHKSLGRSSPKEFLEFFQRGHPL